MIGYFFRRDASSDSRVGSSLRINNCVTWLLKKPYIGLSSNDLCGLVEIALEAFGLQSRTLPLFYRQAGLVIVSSSKKPHPRASERQHDSDNAATLQRWTSPSSRNTYHPKNEIAASTPASVHALPLQSFTEPCADSPKSIAQKTVST